MQSDRLHVGIIMDGNGRWATARGLPRARGHHAGVAAIRPVAEAAAACGVATLTLYAFSSDNWRRPAAEVATLLDLMRERLPHEAAALAAADVRVSVIGRRDRLPPDLAAAIAETEAATAERRGLHLRIAFDYSAREAIAAAAGPSATPEGIASRLGGDVDLLIRTGGEQRLSDFLLWECAYAELLFLPQPWPEFSPDDLRAALAEYGRRTRRFGALPEPVAA